MGLDTVELVMAFEEAFDIVIPDEAAERIVTVNDAIDYIYSQLKHSDAKVCLTQRAFHRIRRALGETQGVQRGQVRHDTRWESLIALTGRRERWSRMRTAMGVKSWPGLRRSSLAWSIIAATSLSTGAAVSTVAVENAAAVGIVAALVAASLLTLASDGWRLHFRETQETVGQTAQLIATKSPTSLLKDDGWTRERVRATVRAIVIEHLNVDPSFSDDASFVDDLGAD